MEGAPTIALAVEQDTGISAESLTVAPGLPFVDTAEHTLDGKWRLTLPAGARPSFAGGGLLVLWNGPCLAVLTEDGFRRWIAYANSVVEK